MNETNKAAIEIAEILGGLPTPRHAAAAIATVRANLFIQGGAKSRDEVSRMMNQDDKAAFEIWETIAALVNWKQRRPVMQVEIIGNSGTEWTDNPRALTQGEIDQIAAAVRTPRPDALRASSCIGRSLGQPSRLPCAK